MENECLHGHINNFPQETICIILSYCDDPSHYISFVLTCKKYYD